MKGNARAKDNTRKGPATTQSHGTRDPNSGLQYSSQVPMTLTPDYSVALPQIQAAQMSPEQAQIYEQMTPAERGMALQSLQPQPPAPPEPEGGIGLTGILGIANMAAGIGRQVYEALKPRPAPKSPPLRAMGGNPFS